MRIQNLNVLLPLISVTFAREDETEFSLDLTLNYIQNIILTSTVVVLSEEEMQTMLVLIREDVLTCEDVKGSIADNELPFDAFVKTEDKLYRFGLSDLDSDPSIKLTDEIDSMYAIRVNGCSEAITEHERFLIMPLTLEQKSNDAIIQLVEDLHTGFDSAIHTDRETHFQLLAEALSEEHEETQQEKLSVLSNYPTFLKLWSSCLETAEERHDFFRKLLATNMHCFIAHDNLINKPVGLMLVSSNSEGSVHYLGNFVITKESRHRVASIPMLRTVTSQLRVKSDSLVATFFTENVHVVNFLPRFGLNSEMARLPISATGQALDSMPILDAASLQLKPVSLVDSAHTLMPPPRELISQADASASLENSRSQFKI